MHPLLETADTEQAIDHAVYCRMGNGRPLVYGNRYVSLKAASR